MLGQTHVQDIIKIELEQTNWSKKEPSKFKTSLKKVFKYSTFYGAITGGNSVSDVDVYSVTDGLETFTEKTPFDYSVAIGVRKIARFGSVSYTHLTLPTN